MDTIFMNSGNSKIYDPYRLFLNLPDKIILKRSDKCDKHVPLTNLSIYHTRRKNHTKIINLKNQLRLE